MANPHVFSKETCNIVMYIVSHQNNYLMLTVPETLCQKNECGRLRNFSTLS